MNAIKIILIAVLTLSAFSTIMLISEERKPLTKGNAVISVILNALMIIGIIYI